MTIVSSSYILLILGTALLYNVLPRRLQLPFVSMATSIFLGVTCKWSLLLLLVLIIGSYLYKTSGRCGDGKVWLLIMTMALFFFGYRWWLQNTASQSWLLLGASFYVLRTLHYLIEGYKGDLPPHTFWDYLNYQLFLPTIVVGPIHRFPVFQREVARRRWDPQRISLGLQRILYGYAKVVILAEFLIGTVLHEYISCIPFSKGWYLSYISYFEYGSHLYCSFSGFSDIAIGFALLLGIRIEENFRWPFLQPNIAQFWKSWHMSLSSWCRDYVYLPITAFTHNHLLGIISSMLILGIWHEWSLRYFFWGLYHGVGISIYRFYNQHKPRILSSNSRAIQLPYHLLSIFFTFHFVLFSFAFTKSEDIISSIINFSESILKLIGI